MVTSDKKVGPKEPKSEPHEIEGEIKALMGEMFGLSPDKLSLTSSLVDDLDVDSIDMIDLLCEINERYELELELFDFEGCKTLGQLSERVISEIKTPS